MGKNHDYGVKVPYLASKNVLDLHIIRYNFVEKITQYSSGDSE